MVSKSAGREPTDLPRQWVKVREEAIHLQKEVPRLWKEPARWQDRLTKMRAQPGRRAKLTGWGQGVSVA
jgi:hypothetical protein